MDFKQRIVVKVGSNVIMRKDGKTDVTRLSAIVDQIAALRREGFEVILISSGAVSSGRGEMSVQGQLDEVRQRQLFSAMGQVKLMNLYYGFFKEYGMHVGQVLTMKENFASRREYLTQRSSMEVMLQNGVIPIVNENDTVSVSELMFTDNDELSGLVASMMCAQRLIILSNVDGIYNGNPKDEGAQLLRLIDPKEDLTQYILTEKSGFGRGGMLTKCNIARKVAAEGIEVIIASGLREGILLDLMHQRDVPHTLFKAAGSVPAAYKRYVAHSESFAKAAVVVNACVREAIKRDAIKSLLPVGVEGVEGEFHAQDIITIKTREGETLGIGRAAYSSRELLPIMGQHNKQPLIRYEYLYLY